MKNSAVTRRKLISKTAILPILAAVSWFVCGCAGSLNRTYVPAGYAAIESFEGGTLYRTEQNGMRGSYDVLVLSGDWKQMGRQYGYLCRAQFADLVKSATALLTSKGVTAGQIAQAAEDHYQSHLDYAKELVQGMAETSGLGLAKQKEANILMGILIVGPGCSSMDAWGDYTGGGPLVAGRNWDIGSRPHAFNRFLNVVIYKKNGAIPVADINYLGLFLFQSAMNKNGIFMDLQNGGMSDAAVLSDLPNSNDTLFTFLMESSTLDQLDARFLATEAGGGLVMNAADEARGRVYEWATFGTRIRNGNGLIASTNHFVSPDWNIALPALQDGKTGAYTKERLANLLAAGKDRRGRIDAAAMMKIFDTTIDRGGPTFPEGFTVYQILAVPADRSIWLKAHGYSGWEKMQLGPLFQ